jgi:hypothetical protein
MRRKIIIRDAVLAPCPLRPLGRGRGRSREKV